jgi:hypothetical protein
LSTPDAVAALLPLVQALEPLAIRFYLGGSLASSVHGVPRASIDADVVVDLLPQHVDSLIAALRAHYYVPEQRVREAVASRRSFNLIHLDTAFKVDVFVQKGRPFDLECLARSVARALVDGTPPVPVATAEDVVLTKLEWYRRGGEVSERQWSDVLGVLKAAGPGALDLGYMRRWAASIGVIDLLERVLSEVAKPPA